MARDIRCWIAALVSLGLSLTLPAALRAQSPAAAPASSSLSGSVSGRVGNPASNSEKDTSSGVLSGRVTDRKGAAQAGITVTILRQDGRYMEKVSTQPDGRFRLGHLAPGLYAAEVAQPSFLPFWKSSIPIQAGAEFLLEINLLSIADSVEIGFPASLKDAAEEWKWVLRATYPQRPILRFQPEIRTASAGTLRDPRERALRGTVQIAAGNESHGFGQDPALRTAFDVAYAIASLQELALAGSAGWERGTPAASLRAAWSRGSADTGESTFSMTARQMLVPGEEWAGRGDLALASNRRVQSLTMGYEEEKELGDHVRLQAGSLYDTLRYGRQMTRWSPFARLTISPSDHSQITIAYTAANPRVLPSDGDLQHRRVDQWLAIPQISAGDGGQAVLEGGRHIEAQWEEQFGPQLRLQAAAFYDVLSETALSLSFPAPDSFAGGLLRDPFSDRYFLSGGGMTSPGARVAVAARLSPDSEIILGYGYAGTLESGDSSLLVDDASALRHMLQSRGENSLTVKTISRLPQSRTRVIASYRWLARNAVAISDPYDRSLSQSDPYLNLYVIQPLPSPDILPGQFEAIADFNNLLAQGYMTLHTPGGSSGTLFPAPRSFRGGFNFIF
jgi:hypothetical protein